MWLPDLLGQLMLGLAPLADSSNGCALGTSATEYRDRIREVM